MDENSDTTEASEREAVLVEVRVEDESGRQQEVIVEVEDGAEELVVVVHEEPEEVLPIVVEVNRKPVSMDVRRATGLEIKAAAIAQGVQIELDFVLAVRRHGRTDPVKDKQEVRLHRGECFVANAADDNS